MIKWIKNLFKIVNDYFNDLYFIRQNANRDYNAIVSLSKRVAVLEKKIIEDHANIPNSPFVGASSQKTNS